MSAASQSGNSKSNHNHAAEKHVKWMRLALRQAQLAVEAGEVPVGAVVVQNDCLVAQAYNQTVRLQDPTAHAEVLALRQAATVLGNHRLDDCTLYVTLEPCCMCTGGVFQARLRQVVFGASEPKTGAAGSVVDLYSEPALNHHTQVTGGVLSAECAALLRIFFEQKRQNQKCLHGRHALRDDALRTPDERFDAIQAPQGVYDAQLPALQGLRMHWLDNAQELQRLRSVCAADPVAFVCLPPVWHWSAYWAEFLNSCTAAGMRCLVPDLPGWGRSDKPKKTSWHSLAGHLHILKNWLLAQNLEKIVLVAHGLQLPLALALLADDGMLATRVSRVVGVDTDAWLADCVRQAQARPRVPSALREWLAALSNARGPFNWGQLLHAHQSMAGACDAGLLGAPYPDAGHAAALKSLAKLVVPPTEGEFVSPDGVWMQGVRQGQVALQQGRLQLVDGDALRHCLGLADTSLAPL